MKSFFSEIINQFEIRVTTARKQADSRRDNQISEKLELGAQRVEELFQFIQETGLAKEERKKEKIIGVKKKDSNELIEREAILSVMSQQDKV